MTQSENNDSGVLYYGLNTPEREALFQNVLAGMNLTGTKVDVPDLNRSLNSLFGLSDTGVSEPFSDTPPEESVLVMNGLPDARIRELLDAIRTTEGLDIELKAVVTEHNADWAFSALVSELREEHNAMRIYSSFQAMLQSAGNWLQEHDEPAPGSHGAELKTTTQEAFALMGEMRANGTFDMQQIIAYGRKLANLLRDLSIEED